MKVHVVFSFNVTGSIADDIIRVESSGYVWFVPAKNVLEIIRHRINMNEKISSHFIAEKNKFAK